jgi:hypothetical protein
MKLSGWKRLGIVITLAWVAGTFGYAFWVHIDEQRSFPARVHDACLELTEGKSKEDCTELYEKTRRKSADIPFPWPNPLTLALGPILPFWLAGWMLLALARWVRRGFLA